LLLLFGLTAVVAVVELSGLGEFIEGLSASGGAAMEKVTSPRFSEVAKKRALRPSPLSCLEASEELKEEKNQAGRVADQQQGA